MQLIDNGNLHRGTPNHRTLTIERGALLWSAQEDIVCCKISPDTNGRNGNVISIKYMYVHVQLFSNLFLLLGTVVALWRVVAFCWEVCRSQAFPLILSISAVISPTYCMRSWFILGNAHVLLKTSSNSTVTFSRNPFKSVKSNTTFRINH